MVCMLAEQQAVQAEEGPAGRTAAPEPPSPVPLRTEAPPPHVSSPPAAQARAPQQCQSLTHVSQACSGCKICGELS